MKDPVLRSPDPLVALRNVIGADLVELHTCQPAKVERWDSANPGLVDVKPVLMRAYINEEDERVTIEQPVVSNVPIAWPRGGGFVMTWPLKPGDPVWLVFAERSLDSYLDTDGTQVHDPEDGRRHNLSDAVCIPGGGTAKQQPAIAHASDLVIGLEDGSGALHVTPSGMFRFGGASAEKALALAEKVNARLDALESHAGSHVHSNGNFGSPTGNAIGGFSAGGGDVGSSKVFAGA